MKAIIARDFAPLDQLVYGDWPEPQATGRTVVIEAEAIGVNYPDGLLVRGSTDAAADAVRAGHGGGRARRCGRAGGDSASSRATGSPHFPRMAATPKRSASTEASVMKLPDGLERRRCLRADLRLRHLALCAEAARRCSKPGETLAVLGASGATGIAAVQIGKLMGAKVIGVASTEEKQAIARQAGADIVMGYDNLRDRLKEATGGNGVDVAFDPVGGDAFDGLARAMAWGGRLLVIGFASGTIPKFPVNLALVKGFSVVGVYWGAFIEKEPKTYADDMRELIGWRLAGKLTPVIEGTYPLADAANVLKRVLGRGSAGKLILRP